MEQEGDISRKVVIILIITLVTITIISWVTLTSYANTLRYNSSLKIHKYSNNKIAGTVGIRITNNSQNLKTKDKATVGIKIV